MGGINHTLKSAVLYSWLCGLIGGDILIAFRIHIAVDLFERQVSAFEI